MSRTDRYLALGGLEDLPAPQREVLERLRAELAELAAPYLDPEDTKAVLDDSGRLQLSMSHSQDPAVAVECQVDEYGRIDITSDALHHAVSLCFNDVWEPRDCLGDLDYAVKVLKALLEGRVLVRDRIGGGVSAIVTVAMVSSEGDEQALDKGYDLAGLIGLPFGRKMVTHRISFVDPVR